MKSIRLIAQIIWEKPYRYLLIPSWIFTLWLFTYLVSLELFGYIFASNALTFAQKIWFVLESAINTLSNLDDPRALSLAIFSFLATVNLLLMFRLFRAKRNKRGLSKTGGATVVTLIGSHCVTCGGSLLAPFVTALAGSGATFSASRISTGIILSTTINILGVILISRSTMQLVQRSELLVPTNMKEVN